MARNSQHISQELRQQLRLSPAQILFGRYLEMSAPEFEDEVRRELDENPALERLDPDASAAHDPDESFSETADQLQRADFGSDEEVPSFLLRQNLHDRDFAGFDPAAVEPGEPDLSPLEAQLADQDLSPAMRSLCTYVIGNLDSNGYLTRSAQAMSDDLAMTESIEVSADEMRRAVGIVRSLDPAGIGAYDLRDCLILQLERLSPRPDTALALTIVKDFFSDIALYNIDKIGDALGRSPEQVRQAFDVIKSLNPKPGAALEPASGADRFRHISPDFILDTDSDGRLTVALGGRVPDLAVESSFTIEDAAGAARSFIRERRESAEQFISLTRRRASTLMAVMSAIISLQPEYFRTFDRFDLRPMVLSDVAGVTHLDISTVSRAINGKYVLTPTGNIALKSLFSERVSPDSDLSGHKVSEAIKAIVDGEDKSSPITDAAIVEVLHTQGIDIARRTVAKYRDALGIPPSIYRKNS